MSFEIEAAVLTAVMKHPDKLNELYVKPEEFIADPRHPLILKTLKRAYEKFESIDFTLMAEYWGASLEKIGGFSYLIQLREAYSDVENFDQYQQVIRENYIDHEHWKATTKAPGEGPGELSDTIEQLERLRELKSGGKGSGPVTMASLLKGHAGVLADRGTKAGGITGARTASGKYDDFTGGHQKSSYTVIAARPSVGKTQYLLNDMYQTSKHGNPSVIFSLEMKGISMVERMVSMIGGIDQKRIRSGQMSDPDWEKYSRALEILESLPIYIDDSPGQTIEYIERQVKALKKKHPGIVVYIDFIQLIKTEKNIAEDSKRVAYISQRIIELKKRYDCPFVVISAVGRKVEERQDKRPMMSDLRESGSIESDADIIAFLYRDEIYNPETPAKGVIEIILAKGRDTGTATFWMYFNGKNGRFTDLTDDQVYELKKAVSEYEKANRKR